jgi:hypothetical protein
LAVPPPGLVPVEVVMSEAGGWLSGHAHFLHWGVVQISLANLIVIALMVLIFVLAVLVKFPPASPSDAAPEGDSDVSH